MGEQQATLCVVNRTMQATFDILFSNLLTFFTAFLLIFLVVILLYLVGKKIAPSNPTKEKTTTYACGEDLPGIKAQFHTRLLQYAVYFTIFDIVAFILATAMYVLGWVAFLYAIIGVIAIIMLRK